MAGRKISPPQKVRAKYRAEGPMLVESRLVADPSEEGTRALRRIGRRLPFAKGVVRDDEQLDAVILRWVPELARRGIAPVERLAIASAVRRKGIEVQVMTLALLRRELGRPGMPALEPASEGCVYVLGNETGCPQLREFPITETA